MSQYHDEQQHTSPTDRQARRQAIVPNSEQWTSPQQYDEPSEYEAAPPYDLYDEQRASGDGQNNINPQLMHHQNRSVPAINTQMHADNYGEEDTVPPLPSQSQYDPNGLADQFGNMYMGQRGHPIRGPPMGEPIPRAGTSMSVRSMQSPQRMGPPNSGGLPVSPDQHMRRQPPGRADSAMRSNSVASAGSGNSGYTSYYSGEGYNDTETDITSLYSYEDPAFQPAQYPQGQMDGMPPGRGYPPAPGSWHGHGHPQYPPPPNEMNHLYAAASDVLGMGPPPGAPPPGPPMHPQYPPGPSAGPYPPPGPSQTPYPPPGPSQTPYPPPGPSQTPYPPPGPSQTPYPPLRTGPSPSPYAAQNYGQGIPPSQSAPYLGPAPYQPGYPSGSQTSLTRGPSSAGSFQTAPPMPPVIPDEDFEMNRPRLQHSQTAASVNPRTQKTKAIDLSAPPYTKEYIDQYRQRIKDDPDPEAQFQYAKYLIDAARKIGQDAKDQRGLRKYRDSLINESLKVIRRLATQGQPYDEAQFFLANCHGTGTLGLQVDHERAYHLYLQAAKQNHPAACYRVAVCNEIGAGTRADPQRAAAFYRKAASLGDTAAMYKLGVILLRGLLKQPPNPREAIGWLRRAAEQADEENPHALHELAMLYENPTNGVVPHDPAYAKDLYTRAGHLGYTHSQFKLGQTYEYGSLTCPVDPRRSIAWYTKAAEKGHSEAELALSGWYLTGSEGVLKQSDSEAYLWARRAANKGLSKAEYAVGYYAEVGIGVKQDIEFAKRWYMRAAAQGNKRAMNRLTEMKRNGNKRQNMARPTRQDAKDECVIV